MSDEASPGSSLLPEWYVMIDGERQGPYGLDALQELISIGRIDGDSSVIRAGTTETLSFGMVDELRPLLDDAPLKDSVPPSHSVGRILPPRPAASDALNLDAATQVTTSSLFEQLQTLEEPVRPSLTPNTVDLDQALLEVASMVPPAPDPDPPPVPIAAVKPNGVRRDIFRKDTPRGLFTPQPDDVAPTARASDPQSAPRTAKVNVTPRPEPVSGTIPLSERPTGSRNEDSLLFKIVESGGRVAAAAPATPEDLRAPSERPVYSGDSSGLLDISSIAGAAKPKVQAPKIDDILTVGSANLGIAAGTLQSPLLAPVPSRPPPAPTTPSTAPPPAFNKTVVYTAAIVSVIVTVGIGTVQVLLHQMDANRPASVVVAQTPVTPIDPQLAQPAPPAPPAIPTPVVPTPPAPSHVTAAPSRPTPPPRPTAAPTPPAPPTAPVVAQNTPPAPARPRTPSPRPAPDRTASPPPPDRTARVAAPAPPPPPPPPPAVDPNLPERPSREVVATAMSDIAVVVRACGIQSPVQVNITFVGSGRATTATVGAPYAGTDIGSCVARAVRGARLPAFREAPLNVMYSFRP